MECRDTERLIDVWLDGDLTGAAAADLESHLAECPVCGGCYGPMLKLLRSPGDVALPEGLRDRVMTAVSEAAVGRSPEEPPLVMRDLNRMARRLRHLRWVRWGGAAAASVAIFVSGWLGSRWALRPESPEGQPQEQAVVVSPWVLSSMAQAIVLRGHANPLTVVAQGVAMDVVATSALKAEADDPAAFAATRPWAVPAAPAPVTPEIPALPPVLRL